MSKTLSFQPNWCSFPGETIQEILKEKGISKTNFATELGEDIETVRSLLAGDMELDVEMANKLSKTIGPSQGFWIRREQQYRTELERITESEGSSWLQKLPISSMIKFGWIERQKVNLEGLLEYFGVRDIQEWKNKYQYRIAGTAFKISPKFNQKKESIATWLRRGELEALKTISPDWDKETFKESLSEIRGLTRIAKPQKFIPQLREICAASGVVLSITPTPMSCPASGAAFFASKTKAIIMLSGRYLTDDHFWFSFFHEAAHLILHSDQGLLLDTDDPAEFQSEIELEANAFAENILIPKEYRDRFPLISKSYKAIIRFAVDIGISPGIVVGQLQFHDFAPYNFFNKAKRTYDPDSLYV